MLQELEIDQAEDFLSAASLSFSPPNYLEITVHRLLTTKELTKLLYSLYNKFNYLFDYLHLQIKVRANSSEISKDTLRDYFFLLGSIPFL